MHRNPFYRDGGDFCRLSRVIQYKTYLLFCKVIRKIVFIYNEIQVTVEEGVF